MNLFKLHGATIVFNSLEIVLIFCFSKEKYELFIHNIRKTNVILYCL